MLLEEAVNFLNATEWRISKETFQYLEERFEHGELKIVECTHKDCIKSEDQGSHNTHRAHQKRCKKGVSATSPDFYSKEWSSSK